MKTRAFHIRAGSRFGQHIGNDLGAKRAVANTVVNNLWQDTIDHMFINDGTSTSYIWCYYLTRWMNERKEKRLYVWTNNHDVAMQSLCERAQGTVDVHIAPGKFDFDYCASLGSETNGWISEKCADQPCLLAVTALDADLGPCGQHPDARQIKKSIMERAGHLIVVADASKLSYDREKLRFSSASAAKWQDWIKARRDNLWVFTDLNAGVDKASATAISKPRTPIEWQKRNCAMLRDTLGDHFITIPTPVSAPPCKTCNGSGVLDCDVCNGVGHD